MDFKNTLRKEIDNKLNSLGHINRSNYSDSISTNLFNSEIYRSADEIFIYISFKNEVITEKIIQKAISQRKKVFAPVIDGKEMNFYRVESLEGLIINKYGIKEPSRELPPEYPGKNSLFILPGVAFTEKGERLGRGGGFYDRYLDKNMVDNSIALAFEDQIVKNIVTEPWDKGVNYIITEKKIYKGESHG